MMVLAIKGNSFYEVGKKITLNIIGRKLSITVCSMNLKGWFSVENKDNGR